MIHRVPTQLVPDLWPGIEEHAKAACSHHPFIGAEDLLDQLLRGHGQLFLSIKDGQIEGFAMMELLPYRRRTVANCCAAGGKRGFLGTAESELFPLLEEWGREQGADTFSLQFSQETRPGWLRITKRQEGKTSTQVIAWRSLDERRRRHDQTSQ